MARIGTSCTLFFLISLDLSTIWIGQNQILMTGFATFTRIITVVLFLWISLLDLQNTWFNTWALIPERIRSMWSMVMILFAKSRVTLFMNMQLFTDTRFYPILYLLQKSFLWLYSLKYCYQIYRIHGALDEYESLKESDRYDQWFWFYSKNRGFRYLWTGRYTSLLSHNYLSMTSESPIIQMCIIQQLLKKVCRSFEVIWRSFGVHMRGSLGAIY